MLTDRLTWDEVTVARAAVKRDLDRRKRRKDAVRLRQMLTHGWVVVPNGDYREVMAKSDVLHDGNLRRYYQIGNLNPYGGGRN